MLVPFLRVPYPILLVLGGLVIGLLPGMPDIELPPDLVLVAFLPPLLYAAAFYTSLRELRANVRPIGVLAVGLVFATMGGVALVAHSIVEGLSWAEAFILGAVVAPTDPLAATSIAGRLGVPRRVVVVLEGEGLVNDATALVLYRTAVAVAVGGGFSLWHAGWRLAVGAVGGVAIGIGVGFVVREVRRRIDHPQAEIGLALLTGYLAYLPAEALDVSAVLAAVTAGIFVGWHAPTLTTPALRLQGAAFWDVLTFILNSVLFALVGLQLPHVVEALEVAAVGRGGGGGGRGLAHGRARPDPLGVPVHARAEARALARERRARVAQRLDRGLGRDARGRLARGRARDPARGAEPRPAHLPHLRRHPRHARRPGAHARAADPAARRRGRRHRRPRGREGARARGRRGARAAGRARGRGLGAGRHGERLRGLYGFRRERFSGRLDGTRVEVEEQSQAYQRLRRELLQAEEDAVVELRRVGKIADDVMHRVLRDIALEVQRLDAES